MDKILAVARNTFREAVRDRILYGFLFFAVCLILFSLVIGQLSLHEEVRATIDIGLAGISFFSVLMAVFLGITLLHKEIEKRTLYTILSRPISRPSYLLGKYLGLSATMLLQIGLMTAVWLVVLRTQGATPTAGIAAALVLVVAETLLVIALAMFFTSFSSPFLSGLFCMGLFVAGRNADLLDTLAKRKGMEALAPLLEGIAAVLPNFYLFFPSGKLVESAWVSVHAQFVQSGYMLSTLAYGAAYTAALLIAAMLLMARRDFV